MEDNNYYKEAYDKLTGFKQKVILSRLKHGHHFYFGIQIFANGLTIHETVVQIKNLLMGYNFKITGDTNSETIIIK